MASNYSVDGEFDVFFVSTPEGSKVADSIFQEAYKASVDAEIEPKKLTEKDCLKLTSIANSNDIFIMDCFDSEAYEYLWKQGARILGPGCVLHCLQHSENLPDCSEHPIYSLCLEGALVTLTGVPAAQRSEVVKLVQWLGGTFTKALVTSTTHLIAQEVASKKYKAAVKLKIPILTLDWLKDSYEKSKQMVFNGTEQAYITKYVCPPFFTCVVTSSGLREKEEIKALVESGGGKYSGEMKYKECTHLVIDKPTGAKYITAKQWGSVLIVKPQWVYDCIKLGCKISEEEPVYSVTREVSTPEKDQFPLPSIPDVSAIQSTTLSSSHIDETALSYRKSSSSKDGRRRSSSETIYNMNNSALPSDDLAPVKCDVLANTKICLKGFHASTAAMLAQIVTNCGGSQTLTAINAHYIIAASVDDDMLQHARHTSVPIISMDWLTAVYSKQSLIDVTPFLLHKPSAKRHFDDDSIDSLPPSKRRSVLPITEVSNRSILDTEAANEQPNEETLLNQYGGSNSATPDLQTARTPTISAAQQLLGATPAFSTNTPSNVTRLKCGLVFANKRFFLALTGSDRVTIKSKIESLGGTIEDCEKSTKACNYRVYPLIIEQLVEEDSLCDIVTSIWVRACERADEVLSVDTNPLYQPVAIARKNLLTEAVITTTGLSVYERDEISRIVSQSGGKYAEDLRRFAVGDLPATTHLICQNPESQKFKAAENWNIHAVTIRWLTDSVSSGILQPVKDYHPTNIIDLESGKKLSKTIPRRSLAQFQQTPGPVHSRIQALKLESGRSTTKSTPNNQFLSTSLLDDPDKSFHANIDLNLLDTPADGTPASKTMSTETPIDVAIDKYLNLAVKKHHVEIPTITTDFSKVLDSLVICISKNLSSRVKQLSELAKSLGAQAKVIYDSTATHLVYQGKGSEAEYRSAKRNKQHIVSPYWLEKCKELGSRIDEALYPYNYNPKKELTQMDMPTNTPTLRRSGRSTRSTLNFDNSLDSSQQVNIDKDSEEPTKSHTKSPSNDHNMTEVLQVLHQIQSYRNKSSMHKTLDDTKHECEQERVTTAGIPSAAAMSSHPNISSQHHDAHTLVTWHDDTVSTPKGDEMNSEILAEMDEDFTQERMVINANHDDKTEDFTDDSVTKLDSDCDSQMDTSVHREDGNRMFQFSGFSNEEKEKLVAEVEALGGTCSSDQQLDVKCTHLILLKPVRNEKFLGAMVKGIWLLERSYVYDSTSAGKFLDEEKYEWGGEGTAHLYKSGSTIESLAKGAHRRRVLAQSGQHTKPFHDWQVILALTPEKMSLKRLLEMGGAVVLSSGIDLPADVAQATHAFIDSKSGFQQSDICTLLANGVKCLKPEYIPTYLITENGFNEQKFLIDSSSGKRTSGRRSGQMKV